MPLVIGTHIGPYEVGSVLGAGGMGEVYRAYDTRLGRSVALKVLPETLEGDPDRVARFEREAKLLAALNHANIASLYELERDGERHVLVMELVEGETLAEIIARGPIAVAEALGLAQQIAEALEAAHEKGIIHRDLKPANVKVTPEGKAKVLDFGLGKLLDAPGGPVKSGGSGGAGAPTNSPTLTTPAMTMAGVILGTAAYMSPEQARGPAFRRSDLWALGAVLYEMLAGVQAFHGEDVADVLAAVVKTDADWSRLPIETPSSIRTLLRRCLSKDKRQRLGDAGAARIEIEEALAAPKTSVVTIPLWRKLVPLGAAALVGMALGGALAMALGPWPRRPPAPQEPVAPARLTLLLPRGSEIGAGPSVAM
jgi:serine/threonine protein kinase